MFDYFFLLVFFIYIFNFLFVKILEKQKIEKKIITGLMNGNISDITCIENNWVIISRDLFKLNIYYFVDKNNKILTCDTILPENEPLKDYTRVKCNKFNTLNSLCYNTLLSLMNFVT